MQLTDFIIANWILCAVAALTAILGIWIKLNWDSVRFRKKAFRYSFPIFGTVASESKKTDIQDGMPGWYKSEWTLCDDFHEHIRHTDEVKYMDVKSYLRKAGDSGRKPTPFAIWILIIGLVVAEAYGFSYVLSGWAVLNASETTQKYGAMGIAFILSTVLVFMTHMAGHAMHRNREIERAKESWKLDANENKPHLPAIKTIDWEHDQTKDDDQPAYAQKIARTGMNTSWWIPTLAGIFIVAVAIGATLVRGKALDESMGQETIGSSSADVRRAGVASVNPFEQLSNDKNPLVENQKAADIQAIEDLNKTHREGGWWAFILLAGIFVFLQILAIIFGMKWGFIGIDSENAYIELGNGNFNSFRDFKHHHFDHRVKIVQGLLSSLQQKMKSTSSAMGIQIAPTKRFLDYLDESIADAKKRTQEAKKPPEVKIAAIAKQSEGGMYDGYSDKQRNRMTKKITLSDLEELAKNGTIDDSCYVLKGKEWIKYGVLCPPELPDDSPPLPMES